MVISRRGWIGGIVVLLVLFLLAGVTSKTSSHPGTVSNIFWTAFLVGAAILIVMAVRAVIQSRRRPAR